MGLNVKTYLSQMPTEYFKCTWEERLASESAEIQDNCTDKFFKKIFDKIKATIPQEELDTTTEVEVEKVTEIVASTAPEDQSVDDPGLEDEVMEDEDTQSEIEDDTQVENEDVDPIQLKDDGVADFIQDEPEPEAMQDILGVMKGAKTIDSGHEETVDEVSEVETVDLDEMQSEDKVSLSESELPTRSADTTKTEVQSYTTDIHSIPNQISLDPEPIEESKPSAPEVGHKYTQETIDQYNFTTMKTGTIFDSFFSKRDGVDRGCVNVFAAKAGAGKTSLLSGIANLCKEVNPDIKIGILHGEMRKKEWLRECSENPDFLSLVVHYMRDLENSDDLETAFKNVIASFDMVIIDSFPVFLLMMQDAYPRMAAKTLLKRSIDLLLDAAEESDSVINVINQCNKDGSYKGGTELAHWVSSVSYVVKEDKGTRYITQEKSRNSDNTGRKLYFSRKNNKLSFNEDTYRIAYMNNSEDQNEFNKWLEGDQEAHEKSFGKLKESLENDSKAVITSEEIMELSVKLSAGLENTEVNDVIELYEGQIDNDPTGYHILWLESAIYEVVNNRAEITGTVELEDEEELEDDDDDDLVEIYDEDELED